MDRGHGPVVAGVHGLKHVDNFFAARFPTMMRSGASAGRFSNSRAGILRLCLPRWGAAFHPAHVGLLQLKFGGVFDGQDAFVVVDETMTAR